MDELYCWTASTGEARKLTVFLLVLAYIVQFARASALPPSHHEELMKENAKYSDVAGTREDMVEQAELVLRAAEDGPSSKVALSEISDEKQGDMEYFLWIGFFVVVPIIVVVVAAYCTVRCYSKRVGSTAASSVIYKAGNEPSETLPTTNGLTRSHEDTKAQILMGNQRQSRFHIRGPTIGRKDPQRKR